MTNHRRRARGFTLLEALFAVTIFAGVSLVIEATMSATSDSERYMEAVRGAATHSQRVMYEVSNLVGTSRRLFENDDVGLAYLDAMDLSRARPVLGARLPYIDESHQLGPDDGTEPWTGNLLLFVREGDALPCVAVAATRKVHDLDSYRFVCIYPHLTNVRMVDGTPSRDLVIWRSEAFVAYNQLLEIPAGALRASVVRDLVLRHKVRAAWSPDDPIESAFRHLEANGNVSGPDASFLVREEVDLSPRGRLVAHQARLALTDDASFGTKAVLARPVVDEAQPWKPDGFEVKVTGGAHSRQVWLHLVIEKAVSGIADVVVQEGTTIVHVKDI